ncbi:MAG: hypothetical protein AB7G75_18770 [Candidatus Binatia bacterium]
MDAEQKQKLLDLLAQEHVPVVTTQSDDWPTAVMQAFAETSELDTILTMLESAPKVINLQNIPTLPSMLTPEIKQKCRRFRLSVPGFKEWRVK